MALKTALIICFGGLSLGDGFGVCGDILCNKVVPCGQCGGFAACLGNCRHITWPRFVQLENAFGNTITCLVVIVVIAVDDAYTSGIVPILVQRSYPAAKSAK